MVRSKKYSVSVDFETDMEERIKAWAQHHGSINQAINAAVREAVLAFEGEETTRVRTQRIDANTQELRSQVAKLLTLVEMLQREKWSQLAPPDGRILVQMKLDGADLDRILQAVKSEVKRND